jgi:hypothetical protein
MSDPTVTRKKLDLVCPYKFKEKKYISKRISSIDTEPDFDGYGIECDWLPNPVVENYGGLPIKRS